MQEVTEKYYIASNGKRFENEDECKEYEEALSKINKLRTQINILNKELASAEYILHYKGRFVEQVNDAGGCGHDGFYSKCPRCEELVGGYEGRNTSLNVDKNIYKCEKCGTFFRYS